MIQNISDIAARTMGNLKPKAANMPEPINGPLGPLKADTPNEMPAASGALSGAINHMVQQGMPIDVKHIVAVKNAIADGQYPVNSDLIAEKIIQLETPGGRI